METTKRLESFDLLRLFFVLLALTAHFRVAQGAGYELPKSAAQHPLSLSELPYVVTITRTSMSALLIIFGFMIEYVYTRLWRLKGPKVVLEKLLTRALICYLAFLTLAWLAVYTETPGGGAIKTYLATGLFVYREDGKAFLFKYYTFLFPVVFVLMWIRIKFNYFAEIATILGLIVMAELIKTHVMAFPKPFTIIGENFFGVGNKVGPSITHALLLVAFGSAVAHFIGTKKLNARAWFLVIATALSVAALGFEIHRLGFSGFVTQMASTKTYRAHNSHVYFAFGILSYLFFWAVSWAVVRQLGDKIKQWISYYGGNTFIIFLYGNIILLFFPQVDIKGIDYPIALTLFLAVSLICVNLYDWALDHLKVVSSYNALVRLSVSKFLAFCIWLIPF